MIQGALHGTLRRVRSFMLLGLLSFACGGRPASELAPATMAPLFELPITFSVPEGEGSRQIHTPVVAVEVDGHRTLLILDTGATDSVFTRTFADQIGAAYVEDEPGTDHAGASVPTFVGTTPLTLVFGAHRALIDRPLFIEGPPPFDTWGVGGIVSPQELLGGDWIEVDLAANVLRGWRGSIDMLASRFARAAVPVHRLERLAAEGDNHRLFIVRAQLEDTPVRAMLNTGGRHSEASPRIVAASAEVVTTGRGVSGEAVLGARDPTPRAFRVGALRVALSGLVVRDQTDDYELQLGIGALRNSVLVLNSESQEFLWATPRILSPN